MRCVTSGLVSRYISALTIAAAGSVRLSVTVISLAVAASTSVVTDRSPHPSLLHGTWAGLRDALEGSPISFFMWFSARLSTCSMPASVIRRQIGQYSAMGTTDML